MAHVRIITEAELRQCMPLDAAAIACVENGFWALAGGTVSMPPVLSLAIPDHNGEVDVKTAYVPGLDGFAIKVSPGFFDNPQLGLPSTSGLMMVFSSRTGQLQALLLDNGYLTDVRTAAAGAVAAKHLSRANAEAVCVMGAGMQARLQFLALCLVRPIRRGVVWARDPARAQAAAEWLAGETGVPVRVEVDAERAVAGADVIVTTTPSTQPILMADWLRPGQHVTAMGSDQHGKNEIDPTALVLADCYVSDRQSQAMDLGELRSAIAAGLVSPERRFAELGDIVTGAATGRGGDDDITIADLTGTGVQDTAIATMALERARAAGFGQNF
ncbi:MAG: ectoine utilization protein EutC [Devosia sp.]|uniref:ectoine utilization protein EutC n=1 Tax=Devosia sp. TaxID=1871048 RepID=UPI0024C6E0CB|nr:ectoine utilization protein EutC [Devosia sp.]UYN98601.1 MAG: ectoine utilization protein EutC [Devosia sp.]